MQSVFMRAAPGHCENSLKSYRQFSQYFGFAGMEAQLEGDFAEIIN